jgi:IclR family acetate operon transcriptional repressor
MSLSALPKSLALLEVVIGDAGQSSVAALARATGLPVATAHRHVAALVQEGLLTPSRYGRHIAGPRLRALMRMLDDKAIITHIASPTLARLAIQTGCAVQLGTYENDMVTYRLKAGRTAQAIFTEVGMQQEAYCSGLGKVLLASLPAPAQAAYLATGPFPALTPYTITEPAALKAELVRVAEQGFALDEQEVVIGLHCIAVPIRSAQGDVIAALSASRASGTGTDKVASPDQLIALLQAAAIDIGRYLC